MARKTKLQTFYLDCSDSSEENPWVAKIGAFSELEEENGFENFSADLTMSTDVSNKTPKEIRREAFSRFVNAFEETLEDLKKIKL